MLFDQALAPEALVLEGRERFRRVEIASGALMLMPSEKVQSGERLRLTVRFKDAGAPEQASFVLVVHRDQAERQVEVSRPRAAEEACQSELLSKDAELQRCLARGPSVSVQTSLASLLEAGELQLYLHGVLISFEHAPAAETAELTALSVVLYPFQHRSVLEVRVKNPSSQRPWRAAGASLRRRSGDAVGPLEVLQREPAPSGTIRSIWVEFPADESPGVEALEVWDEGRQRTFTVKGLRLP
jgi:uncharacterized protein (TIGR02268 family)